MKYFIVLMMILFVGCGGNSNGSLEVEKDIKADPTVKIKTKESANTPPSVPEV
jgi:hypothetical protein